VPPQVHLVPAQTHGRVLAEAPPMPPPWPTLIGFHGYAENAATHLEALRRLDPTHRWLRVSAQGLHRFYGRREAVVASWMTREDRDTAIADNIAYADAVRGLAAALGGGAPVVLVGFSQGVAQAYRAALAARAPHGPPRDLGVHGIVALGGDVPPEVAPHAAALPPVLIGCGTRDTWYTEDKAARDRDVLHGAGVRCTVARFDGGHDWDEAFVTVARAWLDARLAGGPPVNAGPARPV
jgi:predicted esterase